MTVDVIALLLMGIAVIWGWRAGAVSQIGRVAAAVCAVLGAPWGAVPVADIVFADSDWSEPVIQICALFLAGIFIYAAVALTGWLVVRAIRANSDQLTVLDRLGGVVIGAVKGGVLLYFLVTVVVLLKVSTETLDPANSTHLRGGVATGFVERHNILAPWQLPELAKLHRALKVGYYARELGRQRVLHDHARATDFLRSDAIEALSSDPALTKAVVDDNYAITLADPRTRAVLDDDAQTQILSSIDWASLLAEIQSPSHSKAASRLDLSPRHGVADDN